MMVAIVLILILVTLAIAIQVSGGPEILEDIYDFLLFVADTINFGVHVLFGWLWPDVPDPTQQPGSCHLGCDCKWCRMETNDVY